MVAACVAGLGIAAWAAGGLGLGSPLIGEMPSSSTVFRASAAASAGFAPGILAPTEVLAIGPGAGSQVAADRRLAEDAPPPARRGQRGRAVGARPVPFARRRPRIR